jgi:hypothetical protein
MQRNKEGAKQKHTEDDDDTGSSSRFSIPLILSFPSQHHNHPDDSIEDLDDIDDFDNGLDVNDGVSVHTNTHVSTHVATVLPVATTSAFRPIKITPATTTRPSMGSF